MSAPVRIPASEIQVGDLVSRTKADPAPRRVLEIRDHEIARSVFLARTDEEIAATQAHEDRMLAQGFRVRRYTQRQRDSTRIQPKFVTKLWVTRPETTTTNEVETQMSEQTAEQKAAADKAKAEAKAKAAADKKAAAAKAKADAKAKKDAERAEKKAADEAAKKARAEERANRPKKVPLTLSQRKCILALAKKAATPTTAANAKPLDYFVANGLATKSGSGDKVKYTITAAGKERAKEVNPKYAAAA